MAQAAPHPQAATLRRSTTVQDLIQRVFAVTYSHLSKLNGKTVAEYCKDRNKVPKYIEKYFTYNESIIIASDNLETFEVKLSYKLLKTCCGLKEPRSTSWASDKANDTFEYLISFCWTEYENLRECSAVTDEDLNIHMDRILEALVLLVEKVEEEKNVDETLLKAELRNHIGEKLDSYDNSSSLQHMYTILCEHTIHQMLVMVYQHLNHLGGMSLSKFMNQRGINPVQRTGFSNEHKFLESNPPPWMIPVRLLFRIVQRVCFNFDFRRTSCPVGLEAILRNLKREYNTPPTSEMEYTSKCYKVYSLLECALQSLCNKTGKDRQILIGNLARETFVAESIQKPFEPPVSSLQCVSSPPQTSLSSSSATAAAATPPQTLICPPAPPQKDALTVEEMNVCVLFKVMRPGGMVSQTLTLVFQALHGDLQNTKKRKTWNHFMSDEKDLIKKFLDKSIDINEMAKKDLTFLCKILRHCCTSLSDSDDVWSTPNDTIEYNITIIRKERNKMAHEISSIKTDQLHNILNFIEDCLLTILEKVESKLTDDEHDMKLKLEEHRDNLKDEMKKILQISDDLSIKNYWTELNDKRNRVKLAAQQELKHPHLYGESLQCMSPISGSTNPRHKSLTVQQVFIERELEDKNDTNSECTYKIKDILFSHNTPALSSHRVFIIHGKPGDGKTSICKYIFHLWTQNINNGVELLFYIPCRYITTNSLAGYLKSKLPQVFQDTKTDDIIPLLQEPQVMFVIDGYDEAGEDAKSIIDDILTSLPDSKIIFTTKTQWLPKLIDTVKQRTSHYKVMSIMQMTEDERQEYIRKFFNAMGCDNEDCNVFLKYLEEMKEKLNSLIYLPLTFSLLALLWIVEPGRAKNIKTSTQLYCKLIDLILERVTKQLGKNDSFLCREWMIALGQIAWNNLTKNKHYLSEKDQTPLKRRASELGLGVEGNYHIISNLLHCEINNTMIPSEKHWTFTFTSQQEYFAAEYIVDELHNKKTLSLSDILQLSKEKDGEKRYKKKLQRLIPVIELICELLFIHDGITEARLSELTKIMSVKEPWAFMALKKIFRYLVEENHLIKNALNGMFRGETIDTFANYEPESILWVLKNTSLSTHKEITVINAVSDVPQMKLLLETLLTRSNSMKVMLDVDKISTIANLVQFTEDDRYENIRFVFSLWKPMCVSEVIMNWPFPTPLCLSFCPEVFPLVWWEALMCFLTMQRPVSKLVCSAADWKCFKLIREGGVKLNAEVIVDGSLAPTEVIICT